MKKALPGALLLLLLALAGLALLPGQAPDRGERADFPPFVLIQDTYYKSSGLSLEAPPAASTYFGEVLSSVPSHEMPTESFQANDDIVGAPIYGESNRIFVKIEDRWWEYLEYSES